jgi:hypothetical protein
VLLVIVTSDEGLSVTDSRLVVPGSFQEPALPDPRPVGFPEREDVTAAAHPDDEAAGHDR